MTVSERQESDADMLARRHRELSILNRIAEALNRSVDLEEALHVVLALVADLLGLQTGWIWLLREETGESYLAAAQNLPPGLARHPERMEGSCYCLDTYRAGDLGGAANINVVTCSRLRSIVDGTGGLRYHASIPLYAQSRRLGVLNVASPDWRELSAEDLRLLRTIGDLLSIAIERARLFARSAQLGAVEERNRLAREIHDTLAQGLAAVVLRLETAGALLDAGADSARLRETIEQALGLTRASLEEARRSVLDLRAAPLEGRTLGEALSELADVTTARGELQVSFEATGAAHPLPVRIEAGLYRIAQEALTNAVRHAAARTVRLRLETTPERVRLSILDDGRGFDPERVGKERYGLVGLAERAKLLGGRLDLRSGPGHGTRIEVEVPLGQRK
jgi:two-component system, NarL family, sensor kinase